MGRSPGARRSAWEGGGSKEGIKDKGRRGKAGGGKEKLEEERKEERRKRREKKERKGEKKKKNGLWIVKIFNLHSRNFNLQPRDFNSHLNYSLHPSPEFQFTSP